MAKRKTKPRKKKSEEVEKSAFWPLAGSIVLFVGAVFLLLGGFGTGGPLPVDLFKGAYWTLGWAAYLTPVAFIYFGIHKFKSEDKQIPLHRLAGMLALLLMASAWAQVAFVSKDASGEFIGGHGGAIGKAVGGVALSAIDKIPTSLMFFVFTVLAFFWCFDISPKALLSLAEIFQSDDDGEGELAELKQKADGAGFKMNEGVPVEHHNAGRASSLRNTAQKLSPPENHEALTTASDPNWQFPPLTLLNQKQDKADAGDVEGNARAIQETFANFSIDVEMEGANIGPRVTQFTLKPPTGVKLTKMTALENNLALDLAAHSIRMEAPIPGKRAVGIEVPNVKPAMVRISSLLQSREWGEITGPLGFVIGKDISGQPIVGDLTKMPHFLVAVQTG